MRRAAGVVAALIGFAVLSWTGAQSLVFAQEEGRAELLALTRSRRTGGTGGGAGDPRRPDPTPRRRGAGR